MSWWCKILLKLVLYNIYHDDTIYTLQCLFYWSVQYSAMTRELDTLIQNWTWKVLRYLDSGWGPNSKKVLSRHLSIHHPNAQEVNISLIRLFCSKLKTLFIKWHTKQKTNYYFSANTFSNPVIFGLCRLAQVLYLILGIIDNFSAFTSNCQIITSLIFKYPCKKYRYIFNKVNIQICCEYSGFQTPLNFYLLLEICQHIIAQYQNDYCYH